MARSDYHQGMACGKKTWIIGLSAGDIGPEEEFYMLIKIFSITFLILWSITGLKENNFVRNIFPASRPHR